MIAIYLVVFGTLAIASIVGLVGTMVEGADFGYEAFWAIFLWPMAVYRMIRGKPKKKFTVQVNTFHAMEAKWVKGVLEKANLLVETGIAPADAVWSVISDQHQHTTLMLADGNGPKFTPKSPEELYKMVTKTTFTEYVDDEYMYNNLP